MQMQKPQPRINSINRPFWSGCNDDQLLIQQCGSPACGRWFYFPRAGCPYCGATEFSWKPASGEGVIVTYTVVRRPQHPSFAPELPYCFIAVKLKEGPLMYSRLRRGYSPELNLIGKKVSVVFTEHGPGQRLPFFDLEER